MNNTPMRFACDSIPDCQGQIVQRVGGFVIVEGMATDSGYWFAKGEGGARRFQTKQEAADYIAYAQDAEPTKRFAMASKVKTPDGVGTVVSMLGDKVVVRVEGRGQKTYSVGEVDKIAKDVSLSEAQHKAMGAAAGGKSNLGIPKKVGEEFSKADKGKGFDAGNDKKVQEALSSMARLRQTFKQGYNRYGSYGKNVSDAYDRWAKTYKELTGKDAPSIYD
jgi:hypothetical protein